VSHYSSHAALLLLLWYSPGSGVAVLCPREPELLSAIPAAGMEQELPDVIAGRSPDRHITKPELIKLVRLDAAPAPLQHYSEQPFSNLTGLQPRWNLLDKKIEGFQYLAL